MDKENIDWVVCTKGEKDRVILASTVCPFCHKESLHEIEIRCPKEVKDERVVDIGG